MKSQFCHLLSKSKSLSLSLSLSLFEVFSHSSFVDLACPWWNGGGVRWYDSLVFFEIYYEETKW